MARKGKRARKKEAETVSGQPEVPTESPKKGRTKHGKFEKHDLIGSLIVAVVSFCAFIPALSADFIFWDDPEYILNNPYIKEIDLGALFSNFYFGNYHPLTMLSYSLEYALFEFDPWWYHFNSILIHGLNTFLVAVFVRGLLGGNYRWSPLIVALLFGVHPMHVESVAWVSERKDVLFTLFYLLSMISYLKFKVSKSMLHFGMTALFFIGSLLSKGPAVTLPVVLVLIDLYKDSGINLKQQLPKLPLFVLSFIFGYIAIEAQKTQSAINPDYYRGGVNIVWGSYSFLLYLVKSVVPTGLSGVHPYPLTEDRQMPAYLMGALGVIPVMAGALWITFKKWKEAFFGLSFFIITIFLVLKFIPVGDAIIAERYTYISYIGLFLLLGAGLDKLINNGKAPKWIASGLLVMMGIAGGGATWARTQVWQSTFSFWTDVAEKKPTYWRAYNNMAQHYYQIQDYEKAILYYNKAIASDKWCPPVPYMWRGVINLEHLGKYDEAIKDFEKVISFPNPNDPTQIDARINMGLAYYRKQNFAESIRWYDEVIQRDQSWVKAWYLRGLALAAVGRLNDAVTSYSNALKLEPRHISSLLNRGAIYTDKLGKYDLAIADFTQALQIDPSNYDAQVNIGLANYKKGSHQQAIQIYTQMIGQQGNNGRLYYLRALVYAAMGKGSLAVADGEKAIQLGTQVHPNQMAAWKGIGG